MTVGRQIPTSNIFFVFSKWMVPALPFQTSITSPATLWTTSQAVSNLLEIHLPKTLCPIIVITRTLGTTTTADFLSALLYHLSLPENKHHQDKLRQELRTVSNGSCPASSTEHIPLSQLQALPYLNGVLRETLRISPPIPFSLPRVVKTKDQDVTVMGLKINPGVSFRIVPTIPII